MKDWLFLMEIEEEQHETSKDIYSVRKGSIIFPGYKNGTSLFPKYSPI